jgi:hypothetical protein
MKCPYPRMVAPQDNQCTHWYARWDTYLQNSRWESLVPIRPCHETSILDRRVLYVYVIDDFGQGEPPRAYLQLAQVSHYDKNDFRQYSFNNGYISNSLLK